MLHNRWRRVTSLLALGAVAVLVSSCFGGSSEVSGPKAPSNKVEAGVPTPADSPAATPSPDPKPKPPPEQGECRRVSIKGLRTIVNNKHPIGCKKRHTVVTYYVGHLPKPVTRGANASGDGKVENAADRICQSRFRDYVGGDRADRRLSMLTPTYFLPSTRQFSLGARWVRCDAFAYATPTQLAVLPPSLRGALENEFVSDRFSRCSPVSPSSAGFRHVACAQPHQWRAVGVQPLGAANTRYPGHATVQDRARDRCLGQVRSYLGTDGAFSYGFEVPRRHAWSQGDHVGLCWAKVNG